MATFVNFTNHPFVSWSKEQYNAAVRLCSGAMAELPFPNINPEATEEELDRLAERYVRKIVDIKHPAWVLVQGEMTFVYRVVNLLKAEGVICLAACSKREAMTEQLPDGTTKKTSVFRFVKFREY